MYISQGELDMAKREVEVAQQLVNEYQLDLGDDLFKHYSSKLSLLTQEILRVRDKRDKELAEKKLSVYRARFPLQVYLNLEDDAAQYLSELFAHFDCNRFTNPYVFVVVLMNPCENAPTGGGRPVNGGSNNGGGIVVMSSFGLDHPSPFQSTLRHELGHAFGLPHVDVYGYDMQTSESFMSRNNEGFCGTSFPSSSNSLVSRFRSSSGSRQNSIASLFSSFCCSHLSVSSDRSSSSSIVQFTVG